MAMPVCHHDVLTPGKPSMGPQPIPRRQWRHVYPDLGIFFQSRCQGANPQSAQVQFIARYGYNRGIVAWELFNEVDWTDDYDQHQTKVADWLEEMAASIKEIDPYGHLVTTSFAREQVRSARLVTEGH